MGHAISTVKYDSYWKLLQRKQPEIWELYIVLSISKGTIISEKELWLQVIFCFT